MPPSRTVAPSRSTVESSSPAADGSARQANGRLAGVQDAERWHAGCRSEHEQRIGNVAPPNEPFSAVCGDTPPIGHELGGPVTVGVLDREPMVRAGGDLGEQRSPQLGRPPPDARERCGESLQNTPGASARPASWIAGPRSTSVSPGPPNSLGSAGDKRPAAASRLMRAGTCSSGVCSRRRAWRVGTLRRRLPAPGFGRRAACPRIRSLSA